MGKEGPDMPNFDSLNDRIIEDGNEQPVVSMKTSLDPKDPLENNPYYDPNKEYTPEELDKLRKFFGGK
ncbi:hypothetical protein [Radiobacillus deserti]|uniref:Uncharacterized protein n=1 Tax=Radiobacillus deserti TaxID=2594883 RepID=A0A516KC40_9BACI|nr:hypothetical protein [Radiobacillus deserti]QDP38969.1 hypothetical protein FN924_01300 [Radiobacillus deserti]